MRKKWGILIKKESESLDFTGLKIPRDYDGEKEAEIENNYAFLTKDFADKQYNQIEALEMTSVAGEAYASPEQGICAVVNVSFDYRILYSYLDSWEDVRKKILMMGCMN